MLRAICKGQICFLQERVGGPEAVLGRVEECEFWQGGECWAQQVEQSRMGELATSHNQKGVEESVSEFLWHVFVFVLKAVFRNHGSSACAQFFGVCDKLRGIVEQWKGGILWVLSMLNHVRSQKGHLWYEVGCYSNCWNSSGQLMMLKKEIAQGWKCWHRLFTIFLSVKMQSWAWASWRTYFCDPSITSNTSSFTLCAVVEGFLDHVWY